MAPSHKRRSLASAPCHMKPLAGHDQPAAVACGPHHKAEVAHAGSEVCRPEISTAPCSTGRPPGRGVGGSHAVMTVDTHHVLVLVQHVEKVWRGWLPPRWPCVCERVPRPQEAVAARHRTTNRHATSSNACGPPAGRRRSGEQEAGGGRPGMKGARQPGMRGARQPGMKGARQPGMKGVRQPGMKGARQPGMKGVRQPGMKG
eukprot:325803-Chlamydomonas_euryale.AAC.15